MARFVAWTKREHSGAMQESWLQATLVGNVAIHTNMQRSSDIDQDDSSFDKELHQKDDYWKR